MTELEQIKEAEERSLLEMDALVSAGASMHESYISYANRLKQAEMGGVNAGTEYYFLLEMVSHLGNCIIYTSLKEQSYTVNPDTEMWEKGNNGN